MNQQYWYDMNDIPKSNDFILMNYENTFIRIVANSNSGSDGFKFILRFFNQLFIITKEAAKPYCRHWSYPLENSANWTGQR